MSKITTKTLRATFTKGMEYIPVAIFINPDKSYRGFRFRFKNGYGMSVATHPDFINKEGEWEIAVLNFTSGDWDEDGESYIDYSTPVSNDVGGNLTWEQVESYLEQIKSL